MSARDAYESAGARDPLRGAVVGLIAGLVASWAMDQVPPLLRRVGIPRHDRADRRQSGQPRPEEQLGEVGATLKIAEGVARAVTGRNLPRRYRAAAGSAVHYGYGGVMGAVYGALAEVAPFITALGGLLWGTAVWAAAVEAALPAAGLTKPPRRYPLWAHVASVAGHLVYGGATEIVRRGLRRAA